MNKIQKILWSIFSGMICIVYRSDALTVSKTCPWKLLSYVLLSNATCNSISDDTYKNTLGSDLIATSANYGFKEFFPLTGEIRSFDLNYGRTYTSDTPAQYKNHKKFHTNVIGTKSTTSETSNINPLCNEYSYYTCNYNSPDPTDSACCTRCPTAITGIDEDELFATATKEYIKVYHEINSSDPGSMLVALCSKHDIYGKSLNGGEYLQIYEHTPRVIPKQQNANSCVITVASSGNHEYTEGEHSDHTGTYKYAAGDKCYYEKQN